MKNIIKYNKEHEINFFIGVYKKRTFCIMGQREINNSKFNFFKKIKIKRNRILIEFLVIKLSKPFDLVINKLKIFEKIIRGLNLCMLQNTKIIYN